MCFLPTAVAAPAPPAVSTASAPSSYPPHTVVGLPALSPTMKTGNIAKWVKAVGDVIKPGEVIAQVLSVWLPSTCCSPFVVIVSLIRSRQTRLLLTLNPKRTATSPKSCCPRGHLTSRWAHPSPFWCARTNTHSCRCVFNVILSRRWMMPRLFPPLLRTKPQPPRLLLPLR